MRKSALSFANVESESQLEPNVQLQFEGLSPADLTLLKTEALRSNNLADYEAAAHQLMLKQPSITFLKEFIDGMTERKEFKRLAGFHAAHYQAIERLVQNDKKLQWQTKLNRLVATTISNKDARNFKEYKQLRSILLYSPTNDQSEAERAEVESKVALADDLISNLFMKILVGNKQYERVDKTKISSLPYIDVEIVKSATKGEAHMLFLTEDQYVIAYGDNSKGQLLPLSAVTNLDKAAYLPSIDIPGEVLRARHIFTKDNFSAILSLDNRLIIFGEGWTDKYVVIEGLETVERLLVLKNETLLLSDTHPDVLIIDNSLLKDYLLSETSSRKDDNEVFYATSLQKLKQHKIAHKIKKPFNEPLTKIVSGSNHALMLTLTGRLFGYGHNDKNQLCHSKGDKFSQITELLNTKGEVISSIFAFNEYSITIDEHGNANVIGKISRSSEIIRATCISRIPVHRR